MPSRAVILGESERWWSDVLPAVTETVESARPLRAIPLCVADPDDAGLSRLREHSGVIGVDHGSEMTVNLIAAINDMVMLITGRAPEWEVGGVEPGEPYPGLEEDEATAPAAVCAAVNFSLAMPDDHLLPLRPEDCVNHATQSLSSVTVPVVAAGNHHTPGADFETISPWGEPPWVFCVGASADEAGNQEWPHSARGSTSNPAVGPDILAWGQDPFDPDEFGTSFAAARISNMLAIAGGWLLQLHANLERHSGRPFGVPLVGVGVVDRGFGGDPGYGPPESLDALPVLTAEPDGLAGLTEHGDRLVDAELARDVVQAAAVASSAAEGLSAPAINVDQLLAFLDHLTAPALLQIAQIDPGGATASTTQTIFPPGSATAVKEAVEKTMPIWNFNIATATRFMRHEKGASR